MTDERTEQRLDAMLDALRARPARLDEIAQARVRARLEAAIVDVDLAVARSVGHWRRVGVAGGMGLAAAAAVIAVVVAARAGGHTAGKAATADHPAPAGSAATVTDRAAVAGRTAPAAPAAGGTASLPTIAEDPTPAAGNSAANAASPAAAPRAPVTAAAGESVQLALAGTAVTLYGPGQISPTSDGAVVDAAGVLIDRPHGDAPWSVRYRDARIVAIRATFAIEGSARTRVSVIRGQIELYCPSGLRTIRAGGSAACEPVTEIRATPRHRAVVPPPATAHEVASQVPEPPGLEPQAQAQPPPLAELYAAAESALARNDLAAAQDALLAVVNASPDSLDAAIALLDLARLAARRGDTSGAIDYLARLDRHPRRAVLAAPAARLLQDLARRDPSRAPGTP